MRTQANSNLILPNLNRVIPITTTPGGWVRNLVDIVNKNVDAIYFSADLGEQRSDIRIVAMIALNGAPFPTGSGNFFCRCVDGALPFARGAASYVNSTTQLPSANATPLPMPRLAPVTTATLPLRMPTISLPCVKRAS